MLKHMYIYQIVIHVHGALSDFRAEFLVFTILILIIEDVAQNRIGQKCSHIFIIIITITITHASK